LLNRIKNHELRIRIKNKEEDPAVGVAPTAGKFDIIR